MEMIEDYRKNPFYKLEPDEEFVIHNYRLIKKKREGGDLGLSEEPKQQGAPSENIQDLKGSGIHDIHVRRGSRGNAANSPSQKSPPRMIHTGSLQSPLATHAIVSENVTNTVSEEKSLIVGEKLQAQQTFQHAWESKIRVSNSIISPHTFKFSTHIGKTSDMHWENVA